jgi:hypothetical protein
MDTNRFDSHADHAADTRDWNVPGTYHSPVQSLQSQKRDGHPPGPPGLADRKIRDFDERAVTVE